MIRLAKVLQPQKIAAKLLGNVKMTSLKSKPHRRTAKAIR